MLLNCSLILLLLSCWLRVYLSIYSCFRSAGQSDSWLFSRVQGKDNLIIGFGQINAQHIKDGARPLPETKDITATDRHGWSSKFFFLISRLSFALIG